MLILAGAGGNGGGGLVAARHLSTAGARVVVRLATPVERLAPVTRAQYEILQRTGMAIGGADADIPSFDLAIDALVGYSQSGPPRPEAAALIEAVAGRPTVSLDVPSGLELETAELHEPHVRGT